MFRHDSSGTDKSIGADIVSANNGSICTDCRPFPYMSPSIPGFPVDGTPGIGNISKYTGRPQENIVFTSYSGINRYIILHFHIVSQDDLRRDHYILTDIAIRPDHTSCHNMTEMPDFRSFPNLTIFIYNSRFMSKIFLFHNQDL